MQVGQSGERRPTLKAGQPYLGQGQRAEGKEWRRGGRKEKCDQCQPQNQSINNGAHGPSAFDWRHVRHRDGGQLRSNQLNLENKTILVSTNTKHGHGLSTAQLVLSLLFIPIDNITVFPEKHVRIQINISRGRKLPCAYFQ